MKPYYLSKKPFQKAFNLITLFQLHSTEEGNKVFGI